MSHRNPNRYRTRFMLRELSRGSKSRQSIWLKRKRADHNKSTFSAVNFYLSQLDGEEYKPPKQPPQYYDRDFWIGLFICLVCVYFLVVFLFS